MRAIEGDSHFDTKAISIRRPFRYEGHFDTKAISTRHDVTAVLATSDPTVALEAIEM